MKKIYAFLVCLLFASNLIGQGILNQAGFNINGWSESTRSYIDSMKQVSLEMAQRRDELSRETSINFAQIQLEQGHLLNRLNRIDAASRQQMMKDLLSRINKQLKGEMALKFTGGTVPGNQKFRFHKDFQVS